MKMCVDVSPFLMFVHFYFCILLFTLSLTLHSLDIEDMSLKTGSFKRFPLFVKMLASALTKTSDSVFIDLLTFGDLEALKRKKAQNANQEEKAEDSAASNPLLIAAKNKRYFILTYVGEFDK